MIPRSVSLQVLFTILLGIAMDKAGGNSVGDFFVVAVGQVDNFLYAGVKLAFIRHLPTDDADIGNSAVLL